MKTQKILVILPLLSCACLMPASAADFGALLKKAVSSAPVKLPDSRIAEGLKEALAVGVNKAVELTGKKDGYLANPAIKIPLPAKIQKIEPMLRKVGLGPKLDEWTLSMNRAAEAAAPQAKTLFLNALKQMTVEDARKIYSGGETAATEFFKAKTSAQLGETYKPLVKEAMTKYGVTRVYQDFSAKLPPGVGMKSASLENYVTAKALDGLFLTLGEQERAIRKDPAARVTALLKEVFSK